MNPNAARELERVVLAAGSTSLYLAPERGGIATRFVVGDRSVFFLDETTLADPTKNVRGGNPVLFPSPGRLGEDRFTREGRTGAMGQHGFARNEPWEMTEQTADAATLRLVSNDRTRAVFPWDFVLTLRCLVREGSLRIEQRIEAPAGEPDGVPFAIGFHPYFVVPEADKPAARIATTATRAWDNVAKNEIALSGIDLAGGEVDSHLLDHGRAGAELDLGDGHRVEIRASSQFTRWVVWTLPGRDFVCLEPWTAPANALNEGTSLLRASPGAPVDLWLEMALV